ncbi:MAG TPA: CarD family transcriptional regulator [Candidatus Dojkabacteria bacterium]|nr:CarD family transcriptional regulator [Candidatus Dojkabacteria bacterium]
MKAIDIFKNNPAYEKLSRILASASDHLIFTTTQIQGIPFSLQENLGLSLVYDLDRSLVLITRDSLEIRKLINTMMIVSIKDLSFSSLSILLKNHGFNRVLKVLEPGQFSISGDVISFWPLGYAHPIRSSFFGETLDSIYLFDEIYHQKFTKLEELVISDLSKLSEKTEYQNIKILGVDKDNFIKQALLFSGELQTSNNNAVEFDYTYPQLFFQRFDLLGIEIDKRIEKDYKILLFTNNKSAIPEKFQNLVQEPLEGLDTGIESANQKIFYLSDRELFGTIFLSKVTKSLSSSKARQMLADLEGEIGIGDYIVHEDHGIGIYKGIKQEEFEQRIPLGFGEYTISIVKEDYILIQYAGSDELYVPLTQIGKITKYIAQDGLAPQLTSLGKAEWSNYNRKVKADIKKIAKELVSLYARRELAEAPKIAVSKDDEYEAFCDEFQYEETKDQKRSELEVLSDLMLDKPMNRLIVGDVGFGKTEIAIRASFQVARAGMQVAVLCPTTVLAAQHEKVFKERFKNTPFNIASLSRLNKYDNTKVINELEQGKIDIVIGTHRLLSSDVVFKNLGLLVIDEEQKFGVKQKERIKGISSNIHILSMSATPIPRTLSMALSSIQEISLISTPPSNRLSIKTKVEPMNWSKVVNAIDYEVQRGGQIYYLHNRVETIESVYAKLQALMPKIKFVIAHGQLDVNTLSKRITDFYNQQYDVLICTTIIENGIDMPNVNTIIIEQAQNFGLGQLYQLRGRVGRSNRQAYAYLFFKGDLDFKPQTEIEDPAKAVEQKYVKRLKAILETSELGSGFKLASKDLEIRGAGNLLGKAQHGHIKYMGYGLYMQLLAEEIERQKNNVKEAIFNN